MLDVAPPTLSSTPSEDDLTEYCDTVCLEPCDREFLMLVLLDEQGRQVRTPARLHGVPRLPRDRDAADLVDMITGVASQEGATACVLIWQTLDDTDLDDLCARQWADALSTRLARSTLACRGQVHRSPSGFRLLLPGTSGAGRR
ncbi:hypothetical protein ACPEEZ_06560 [Frigoribacterium sp. 2-23]|uniref:hypothetical protein n=1 Tax=Frigoribacterium sp. 2-23 TaxID=3415006 RepID=UPI003C6EFF3A